MIKKEHEFILNAVLIEKNEEEINYINKALDKQIDWIEVVGIAMNHRLGGYFYNGLTKEQRTKIPRELKKNIEMLVYGQAVNQEKMYKYINELNDILENCNIRYAGLKGIIYGACLYTKGTRRSNDMDLLVHEEDLEQLDAILSSAGYIQAKKKEGKLIEASRKEKLIQRMNYHDLIPYMKETDDGIIEIDINFLFDGKDNLIDSKVFDIGTRVYNSEQYSFRGLEIDTNLAFLICHFYREATGEIWVNNKRNLIIYKIVDMVNFIRHFEKHMNTEKLIKLFKELNIIEKALYSFLTIQKFYNQEFINEIIECISSNYNDIYQKYVNNHVFEKYFEDSFSLGK